MRYFLTILFFAAALGCTRTNINDLTKSNSLDTLAIIDKAILDSVDFVVLNVDTLETQHIFPSTYTSTDLIEGEIIKCEKLLKSYILDYNKEAIMRFDLIKKKYPNQRFYSKDFTIELKDYGRQYIAALSDKGDKVVYVNCYCNPAEFSYRDKELVDVDDGGNCYFDFKVDLNKNEIFDFATNGWTP